MTAKIYRQLLAPLLLGILLLGAWQGLVVGLQLEPFVLPAPTAIGETFLTQVGHVTQAALSTGFNALMGLIVGSLLGIVFAIIASLLRPVDRMGTPLVTALSVIPIVALAPVLYTMFGAAAETARQIVASLAAFVPLYFNSLKGFRSVEAIQLDLMRALAADPWQRLTTVTLPNAVPHMATGLRTASSLAVISALIAEYFGGPATGLGKAITTSAAGSNYTMAWAYVLGAVLLGLVFYASCSALETLANRKFRIVSQ